MVDFPNDLALPDEHKDIFYAAVGRLIIEWGIIEGSASMMIAVIYHYIGGRNVDKILPFMYKDKVAFLRKCLFQIAALKPYRKKYLPLLQKISAHTKMRIGIVHGYMSGYDPDLGAINFTKLDGGGPIHMLSNMAVTIEALQNSGATLADLGLQLATEMEELAKVFVPR